MKSFHLKIVISTVALVCFGISFSNAQVKSERPKKLPTFKDLLAQLDTNEDGKLSEAEVKGSLKENFAQLDKDEDGCLSEAELKKAPKKLGTKQRSNK